MNDFAEQQRLKWEANVRKMNAEREQKEKEKKDALEAKKRLEYKKINEERARIAEEKKQKLKEEKEQRILQKEQEKLEKQLKAQAESLARQQAALSNLEFQIVNSQTSQQSSDQTAKFESDEPETRVDENNEFSATPKKLARQLGQDDTMYNEALEQSYNTLKSMSLKEFMTIERKLAQEDPLNASIATEMTELVFRDTGLINQEDQTEINKNLDFYMQNSFKQPRANNFVESHQSLGEIQIDLPPRTALEGSRMTLAIEESMEARPMHQFANGQEKNQPRKDQVIFEMELKANINSVKRQQSKQEANEQQERMRLQQEILMGVLRKSAASNDMGSHNDRSFSESNHKTLDVMQEQDKLQRVNSRSSNSSLKDAGQRILSAKSSSGIGPAAPSARELSSRSSAECRSDAGFSDMDSYKSESLNDRTGTPHISNLEKSAVEGASDYFKAGTNEFDFGFDNSLNQKLQNDGDMFELYPKTGRSALNGGSSSSRPITSHTIGSELSRDPNANIHQEILDMDVNLIRGQSKDNTILQDNSKKIIENNQTFRSLNKSQKNGDAMSQSLRWATEKAAKQEREEQAIRAAQEQMLSGLIPVQRERSGTFVSEDIQVEEDSEADNELLEDDFNLSYSQSQVSRVSQSKRSQAPSMSKKSAAQHLSPDVSNQNLTIESAANQSFKSKASSVRTVKEQAPLVKDDQDEKFVDSAKQFSQEYDVVSNKISNNLDNSQFGASYVPDEMVSHISLSQSLKPIAQGPRQYNYDRRQMSPTNSVPVQDQLEPVPNTQYAQARKFYYDAKMPQPMLDSAPISQIDNQSVDIRSELFDAEYAMQDQSQVLQDMLDRSANPSQIANNKTRKGIDFDTSSATNKTVHQIVLDQSDTSAAMVNMAETMDHFTSQQVKRQNHYDQLAKVKGRLAENFPQKNCEPAARDSDDEQLIEEVKFEKPMPSPSKNTRLDIITKPSKNTSMVNGNTRQKSPSGLTPVSPMYSNDDFESEEEEPSQPNITNDPFNFANKISNPKPQNQKAKPIEDKYELKLGLTNESKDEYNSSLKDTSHFGQSFSKPIDSHQGKEQKDKDEYDEFFGEFDDDEDDDEPQQASFAAAKVNPFARKAQPQSSSDVGSVTTAAVTNAKQVGQRSKWVVESFGNGKPAPSLEDTDKTHLFKQTQKQIQAIMDDYLRGSSEEGERVHNDQDFQGTNLDEDEEIPVAETVKAQRKKGVLLEFDESLDDFKKRKFEEFKNKQQARLQDRVSRRRDSSANRSPTQLKDKAENLVKRAGGFSPCKVSKKRMQSPSAPKDYLSVKDKKSPGFKPAGGTKRAGMMRANAQIDPEEKMSPCKKEGMSPRPVLGQKPVESPAALGTPSVIPKKAYQKQSNQKMIKLALNNTCLVGKACENEREEINEAISNCLEDNYCILFKGMLGRQDYRALYSISEAAEGGQVLYKIHGQGSAPIQLSSDMIEGYFKYQTGAKAFKQMEGQKQINLTTDAICLKKEYQPKTKPKNIL